MPAAFGYESRFPRTQEAAAENKVESSQNEVRNQTTPYRQREQSSTRRILGFFEVWLVSLSFPPCSRQLRQLRLSFPLSSFLDIGL